MGDDNTIYENIQKEDRSPNKVETAFLHESLSNHFFFKNLTTEELETVIKRMFYCLVNKGEYIFKQEEPASCFFIIFEGECAIEIDGKPKKQTLKAL